MEWLIVQGVSLPVSRKTSQWLLTDCFTDNTTLTFVQPELSRLLVCTQCRRLLTDRSSGCARLTWQYAGWSQASHCWLPPVPLVTLLCLSVSRTLVTVSPSLSVSCCVFMRERSILSPVKCDCEPRVRVGLGCPDPHSASHHQQIRLQCSTVSQCLTDYLTNHVRMLADLT